MLTEINESLTYDSYHYYFFLFLEHFSLQLGLKLIVRMHSYYNQIQTMHWLHDILGQISHYQLAHARKTTTLLAKGW